ncbi:MAG: LysR substrate-binding domain-containing protein [Pseudomonadota bacterium]
MRYTQLRAFHHVALEGGFSRAAEALNQTQPSLSDQVRRLEQTYDTLLFHREGRQVRLTTSGEALLRLTRNFFEAEDRIAEHLDLERATLAGTLRIIADSATHITGPVGAFRARHPEVFIRITTGNTEIVLSSLRNYEAEIGVVGKLPDAPDIDTTMLGHSPIVAIASPGLVPAAPEALDLADLLRWPLIFREKGSRTRALLEDAATKTGLTLTPVMEVEGREAMREMVAAGAGLGFVSRAELGPDTRLIALPLRDQVLAMPEMIVSLKARADVPVIRAFRRFAPVT